MPLFVRRSSFLVLVSHKETSIELQEMDSSSSLTGGTPSSASAGGGGTGTPPLSTHPDGARPASPVSAVLMQHHQSGHHTDRSGGPGINVLFVGKR